MNPLPYQVTLSISSVQALSQLAANLAVDLQPGDVLALDGPLGAGKTTFCQQLGKALGIQEPVASPTFVLIHEYHTGRMPLAHADLYRLGEDKADTLADELISIADEGRAIILVEWACYGSFMAELTTVSIALEYDANDSNARKAVISSNRPLSIIKASKESNP